MRRRNVETWLTFWCNNHPGYCDIEFNQSDILSLPEDGNACEDVLVPEVIAERQSRQQW
jgi:hypothetical protein